MNIALFPVVVLGALQSIVALLLLAPLPVARIGINLCKATITPVGKTFLATITVFLIILLVPPILEVRDLRRQSTRVTLGSSVTSTELDTLHRRNTEALAYLSAVMTGFSLLMNFVLQKLGIVLSEKELAKLKEATLLKQVKGLHAEYDRLSAQQPSGGTATNGGPEKELKAELEAAQKKQQEAEEGLKLAKEKQRKAELNADALKSQTRGLESEYDRLLATNDTLERKLARLDPSHNRSAPGSKKDW